MYETKKNYKTESSVLAKLTIMKNTPYTKDEILMKVLIGASVHIKCNCLVPIDIIGYISNTSISNDEILLYVTENRYNKILTIGLNHPGLTITIL